MRATSKNENIKNLDKICVDTNELMSLLSCGRTTAVQIGGQAGARIEIGKRLLWNISKVQKYLDTIATE